MLRIKLRSSIPAGDGSLRDSTEEVITEVSDPDHKLHPTGHEIADKLLGSGMNAHG